MTDALETAEARALLELTREIADAELAPVAAAYEEAGEFPRDLLRTLGRAGLLSLPFPERFGGGEQPYEVYLAVLEELSRRWLSVGISVSVHVLATYAMASAGDEDQQQSWMPWMLDGDRLGAYCLSEPQSGSDAAALQTRAVRDGDDYVITGTKSWITHGGVADFYSVMTRTSDDDHRGITCLLVPADAPGLSFGEPERKMGATASRTAQVLLDGVRVPVSYRVGAEGAGFPIALSALDSGRLGIAACAVGLAQAALEAATSYATERRQFGRPIGDFQGISFMLADMATKVAAARALYREAARLRDAGLPFSTQAAMAKLFSTDTAMSVTTDAIQIHGGYGYTRDFPVERFFREAKVLQIVEGTNQVQRLVIGRALTAGGLR
ncbi:MAG: acyl-CoA dehydrogenase family protein [Candidatus Nanopelagicales bacterium]|jgi:alkylation response protein AidB-like acyl-CoA dehydrogenase